MPLEYFHPFIREWFASRFSAPSEAQAQSWPAIVGGNHTLLAAPTGSGKTLAAFLASIDQLLRQSLDRTLPDETQVVYVSPLKALSNDIHRNLQEPLAEIHQIAIAAGADPLPIRVAVRTGDTPAKDRQAMLRKAPHILVTTPESFYLLLTSAKSREILRNVRTVIVDEIHALARDKRGSHLTLSLARLDHLCSKRPTRIGLSATQRPIEDIARFLVGSANIGADGSSNCRVIDIGHVRELDLAVEVPPSELSAVCSVETWQEIYARLCELINSHRSTLVFVNTRRLAERVTHFLEEKLGKGSIASHHGSLSRETRLRAEEQLKAGQLKAIVATASLELGIDIGYIDLVCQIGSPRSIATFLQRVGRAGHALGRVPKGRLFALTRDELLESLALVRAVKRGRLDRVEIPTAPLDILAQQIVAAVACDEWQEDDLYAMCREAWPYCNLDRRNFDEVVAMLSEGIAAGNRTGAYLHRDQIHHRLRGRRNSRISALTSGGAIPEMADYRVVTEGDRTFVGTLNEDFAMESQTGNVFQLGNTSWRILYVRGGEVTVRDAHGAPATVPFWLGEAPGRTPELSQEFSELREEIWEQAEGSNDRAVSWLQKETGANEWAAQQAVAYVAAQGGAIGVIPSQRRVVFERFFDESGGMQLVIHAPFGARINRAWGLALRKCFCRNFDFELQAIADDNGIVLAMGPQQSFPLEQMLSLLEPSIAESVLTQALLAAPMFGVRWRWNVTRALAVLRLRGGKKVPPYLQRFRAEDLLTSVFPMQTACFEHRTGDLEPPNHPLVRQTVHDCLNEVMDYSRWMDILRDIESGKIQLIGRDTREPSPFSHQLVNSNVYTFLDDAPIEERRARAVAVRRTFRADDVRDLGQLDPAAIDQVRSDAWPIVRDADELHDVLLSTGAMPETECGDWLEFFSELETRQRAIRREVTDGPVLWIATERWPIVNAAVGLANGETPAALPESLQAGVSKDEACSFLVRGRLEIVGPVRAERIASDLGLSTENAQIALEHLELAGFVLRGHFTPGAKEVEWCERRLLARIHRQTMDRLRRQIAPVDEIAFMRFLLEYQGVVGDHPAGEHAAKNVIGRLQGFEAPLGAWEHDLLPARLAYDPDELDCLFAKGEVAWGRLEPPQMRDESRGVRLTRSTPISLVLRNDLNWLLPTEREISVGIARWDAQAVYEALKSHGALFFGDLLSLTNLMPSQLDDALRELAALGMVTADGFAAIRSIGVKSKHAAGRKRRTVRTGQRGNYSHSGRWSLFPPFVQAVDADARTEKWAWLLLRRYGVMFRDLVGRESLAPPWGVLARAYRRLEMRGEIRGGRFVAGVGGEQFALPEAVEQLRKFRDQPREVEWAVVSAVDPLNLIGVLTKGAKVPAVRGNRLAFRNGQPIGIRDGGEIRWLADVETEVRDKAERLLTIPPLSGPRAARERFELKDFDVALLADIGGGSVGGPREINTL